MRRVLVRKLKRIGTSMKHEAIIYKGHFHCWSKETDKDGVESPVAIVETDDGECNVEYAGHVEFIKESDE